MKSGQTNVCEESTFEKLFLELSRPLRDYLYYLSGDTGLSEDLVQEIFFKIWEKCKDISAEKVRAYAFTVARNEFLKDIERKKVRFRYKQTFQEKTEKEDPQFQLEAKEFQERLENAIDALPDGQKEVFLMNRIQKMTYAEMAEVLGISQTAVEKRMSKALKKMSDLLKKNN